MLTVYGVSYKDQQCPKQQSAEIDIHPAHSSIDPLLEGVCVIVGVGWYQSMVCSIIREEPAKMHDYSRISAVRQIKPHTVMKPRARVSLRSMRGDALRNV